jgi:mannose-6-phosphate isomerase-like protein (cupin superfamily)
MPDWRVIEGRYLRLVSAVRRLYLEEILRRGEGASTLAVAEGALADVKGVQKAVEPARLPVCRHLEEALEEPAPGRIREVAAAFRDLEPHLRWRQNPNYDDQKMGAGTMQSYGYTDFFGTHGLARHAGFAAGLLLLGPGILYPDHHHAAAEVYHVLSGAARWRREDGPWESKPPGSCIYHAPWTAHAIRCGEEPLLALYCWVGEVDHPAYII